jgi:hypothetical protein
MELIQLPGVRKFMPEYEQTIIDFHAYCDQILNQIKDDILY